MIKISKEESKYLQKQGFRFGSTLHKTVHGYNYYMSEYAVNEVHFMGMSVLRRVETGI